MRRVVKAHGAAGVPANDLASPGHPSEGDVASGTPATILGPYWFHLVQEAVVTVCELGFGAGNLSDDPNQFKDAIIAYVAAQIDAIPDSFVLADVAEHTQPNPPGNEAATPLGVKAAIDAAIATLVGGAPGALDTLNELAEALNDDANFAATITAAVNARLTQAEADLRYQQKDVVLASDIDLAAGVRATQALAQPLDDFRWLAVIAGDHDADFGTYLRFPSSSLPNASTAPVVVGAYALVGSDSQGSARLYSVDVAAGTFSSIGSPHDFSSSSLIGIGLASFADTVYALVGSDIQGSARLYSVDVAAGTFTPIGSAHDFSTSVQAGIGLASHAGTMYALVGSDSQGSARLYSVDVAAGTFTPIGDPYDFSEDGAHEGIDLASHAGTMYALVSSGSDGRAQLYSVDVAAGTFTPIGSAHDFTAANDASIGLMSHNGTMYALVGSDSQGSARLYSADVAAGTFTPIGDPYDFSSATLPIIGIGLSGASVSGLHARGFTFERAAAQQLAISPGRSRRIHEIIGLV